MSDVKRYLVRASHLTAANTVSQEDASEYELSAVVFANEHDSECDRLRGELERVTVERDKAVQDRAANAHCSVDNVGLRQQLAQLQATSEAREAALREAIRLLELSAAVPEARRNAALKVLRAALARPDADSKSVQRRMALQRESTCKHDDGDCHADDPCDSCPVYRPDAGSCDANGSPVPTTETK